ncbi:MAG: styrene monooxygenase/indole monooxygenase family protein [Byssovorax sp.]
MILLKHGVRVVIYTDQTAEQQRAGRLLSVPTYFAHTRERERALGISHWDEEDFGTFCLHGRLPGETPLTFRGDLSSPALCIDPRVTLPRLLEDFEDRGGRVVTRAMSPEEVVRISSEHDLIVVCSGRGGLASMFPRIEERSPFRAPQRLICSGMFRGVSYPDPLGLSLTITEHGEVFYGPIRARQGHLTNIAFEALPGGAFEVLARTPYAEDPARFEATLLDVLSVHAPTIRERVSTAEFGVSGPLDLVQGAVTPVVRESYRKLDGGVMALAIGDAHIVNDPITGQGANLASREAWLLGHAIIEGGPFDEAFCQKIAAEIWAFAQPVVEWTNLMLGPPAPQVLQVLGAATQSKAVADVFADNFNDPSRQWEILSSMEHTQSFLQGLSHAGANGSHAPERS